MAKQNQPLQVGDFKWIFMFFLNSLLFFGFLFFKNLEWFKTADNFFSAFVLLYHYFFTINIVKKTFEIVKSNIIDISFGEIKIFITNV